MKVVCQSDWEQSFFTNIDYLERPPVIHFHLRVKHISLILFSWGQNKEKLDWVQRAKLRFYLIKGI